MRLLLVEDDELQSRVVAEACRSMRHEVVHAASYDEALAALQSTPIDAVLSDDTLGVGGTGTALRRWVDENRASLPFALMSGHYAKNHVPNETGRWFLAKPFRMADLEQLLSEIAGLVATRSRD